MMKFPKFTMPKMPKFTMLDFDVKTRFRDIVDDTYIPDFGSKWKILGCAFISIVLLASIHSQYVSIRPNILNPMAIKHDENIDVIGYRTISTAKQLVSILLTKSGGYTSNDKMPPYSMLNDMPSWELGVIKVVRDFNIVNRASFTKNQTQSVEDPDAIIAQTKLNIDTESWMFPSVEGWLWTTGEYQQAVNAYQRLEDRLIDNNPSNGNFYTRATSLAKFISHTNEIMATHSQRLSASVNKVRMNTNAAGDRLANQSKADAVVVVVDSPPVDEVFWEAQGAIFASVELLKAIRVDFKTVLMDKNALSVINQIIRELEKAQGVIYSPRVLNGSGYGFTANYSLVAGGSISRASAAMTDLQRLLDNG